MADVDCAPCTAPAKRGIHPVAVLIFCPHCVLSGVFAAAAAGAVTLPVFFGVHVEWLLPPIVIVGGFATWLWWGRRSERARGARVPE